MLYDQILETFLASVITERDTMQPDSLYKLFIELLRIKYDSANLLEITSVQSSTF